MQILRPPQVKVVDEIRAAYREGHRRVLLVAGTGFGKTTCCSHIIHSLISKGNFAVFLAHRIELLDQCSGRLREHQVKHGVLKAGRDLRTDLPVYVASVPTLVNRFKDVSPGIAKWQPKASLIVVDEAHRATAPSYRKIISHYPDALVLGLTATPQRTSGEGLSDMFDVMIQSPSVAELIELGWLAPYRIFESPTAIDFGSLSSTIKAGEFAEAAAAAIMDKPDLIGDVYKNWKIHADGQRTIIFAVNRAHAQHIVDQFKSNGENFEYVDGDTEKDLRASITSRFSSGKVMGVVNVGIFSEGYDVPATSCIVMARPTASLILWLQACGRGLRPAPGKTYCTILDHGGNARRHGFPDDPREWSLDAKKKRQKQAVPSFTTCPPPCCAVLRSATRSCPVCGTTLSIVAERDALPTVADAVLVEAPRDRRAREAREKEMALEEEKKYLTDSVQKQVALGYNWKFALVGFKKQFDKWPKKMHGVHIDWVHDGENYFISSWTHNGVRYGDPKMLNRDPSTMITTGVQP